MTSHCHQANLAGKALTNPKMPRSGSTYFVVIAIAAVATISAFTALTLSSSNRYRSQLETDFTQSNWSVHSSLDVALESIQSDSNWRTTFSTNKTADTAISISLGPTRMEWYLVDPIDNDISNNEFDPVKIFSTGITGQSQRTLSALAFPTGVAIDVLRSPIHATGNISLSESIVVSHGPLSSDGTIDGNNHSVFGSIESNSVLDLPNVFQSSFNLASTKHFPSELVFSAYESLATPVDYASLAETDKLKDLVISNQSAPSPTTNKNVNGVYLIEVPASHELEISNCKITGTLLVRLLGNQSKINVQEGVFWNPHRPDFPSLIVITESDSQNDVELHSQGTFSNPFSGTDIDASLRGVFHVIRPANASSLTYISASKPTRGSFLVEGDVQITQRSILGADPSLMDTPPIGYQLQASSSSLLASADMEEGLAPWRPKGNNYRGGGTYLSRSTDSMDASFSLKVGNRFSQRNGIAQDITAGVSNGTSYSGTLSAKMVDTDESIVIGLRIVDDNGIWTSKASAVSFSTSWQTKNFNVTPTWTGELKSATLLIYTDSSNQDFLIDNISVPLMTPMDINSLDLFPTTMQLE